MTEIKILCSCGTKFKFDVEPVNGEMPGAVACPQCGIDATSYANAHLKQLAAASVADAPMSVAPGAAANSPALKTPAPNRLRISHPAAVSSPAAATPPPSEVSPAPPGAKTVRRQPAVPTVGPVTDEPDMRRFGMGILGALAGLFVGLMVYYMVYALTGYQVKLLAIGVGYLAGLGAQILGKREGSKELGLLVAVLVVGGLFGVQYFMGASEVSGAISEVTEGAKSWYDTAVEEAKVVVARVPNATDDEIRQHLVLEANQYVDDPDFVDDPVEVTKPSDIAQEEIDYFRMNELTNYLDLASGKKTREEFEKELALDELTENIEEFQESSGYKMILIVKSLSMFNIVCIAGGAGLAWRMSADA